MIKNLGHIVAVVVLGLDEKGKAYYNGEKVWLDFGQIRIKTL